MLKLRPLDIKLGIKALIQNFKDDKILNNHVKDYYRCLGLEIAGLRRQLIILNASIDSMFVKSMNKKDLELHYEGVLERIERFDKKLLNINK